MQNKLTSVQPLYSIQHWHCSNASCLRRQESYFCSGKLVSHNPKHPKRSTSFRHGGFNRHHQRKEITISQFPWAYRLPISINGISLANKLAHEVNIQPDAPSHIICSCRIMPFKLKLKRVSGQSYCRHQLFRLVVDADANWRLQLRSSNIAGAPRHIHNNTMLLKSRQSRMGFDDEKCVLCCPSWATKQ